MPDTNIIGTAYIWYPDRFPGPFVYTVGGAAFDAWLSGTDADAVGAEDELTLTHTGSKYFREEVFLPVPIKTYWTLAGKIQSFKYEPGQYVKGHTDGQAGIFVYINGVWSPVLTADSQWNTLSLDTLGLTPGEYYPIRFLMVWCDVGVRWSIETNFALEADYMVALSQWIIGPGTLTPAAGAVEPGALTIVATPGTGYKLSTLTLNGSAIASGSVQTISTHTTIAALFVRDLKTVHTRTRDEIIAAALRKCQVLAEGELPTNDQISTGAEALERFMQHSQSDCEFRWQFKQRTEAVAADQQVVTLTDSEDVLDVYNLFLRDANGMDTPLRLVDAHWYDSTLASKATSDALPAVAVATFNRDPDTQADSVSLSIYPKPGIAYTLYYRAMIKQYVLENGTDTSNWDEMWCEVVVYGLAARLADEYNRQDRAIYLENKFEKLKDAAKRKTGSTRDSLVMFPV